jgi:hypothetical protein
MELHLVSLPWFFRRGSFVRWRRKIPARMTEPAPAPVDIFPPAVFWTKSPKDEWRLVAGSRYNL